MLPLANCRLEGEVLSTTLPDGSPLCLVKPATMMNLSGVCVHKVGGALIA